MRRLPLHPACLSIPRGTVAVWLIISLLSASSALGQSHFIDAGVVSEVVVEDPSSSAPQSVAVKSCVGNNTICVDPQDEIWLVSAHQAQCKGCCVAARGKQPASIEFETQQLVGSQWQPQSFSDLAISHQSDPGHVTVMVFHGNNTNNEWALTRGMQFYDQIYGQNPDGRTPVRLVIVAWESEKVLPRPCPDYKLKSARAAALGADVGALLGDLGGSRPVLVGYSLGCQIVLSTLTELAASECQTSIQCQHGFHVAVIAPALEGDFACGDLATIGSNPLIDDAQIFVNRNDRVALAARLINRKRCEDRSVEPSLVGLADKGRLDSCRFQLHDVTREVRNRHSLVNYIQSATVRHHIRQATAKAAAENLSQFVELDGDLPAEESTVTSVNADSVSTAAIDAAAESSASEIQR